MTDRPTDRPTDRVKGKLHFQKENSIGNVSRRDIYSGHFPTLKYLYEAEMTAKKSTKTGKNFRGRGGKYFSGWPEYIPLVSR